MGRDVMTMVVQLCDQKQRLSMTEQIPGICILCISGNVIISFLHLKDSVAGYRKLD